MRPGVKRTFVLTPAFFAASSTATVPPSTMRSARETFFADFLLNALWIFSSSARTFFNSLGLFASQFFCGSRRIRAPFAPPRLSVPRNVDADAHAVVTNCAMVRLLLRIFFFNSSTSDLPITFFDRAGSGSCQINSSFGTSGPRYRAAGPISR